MAQPPLTIEQFLVENQPASSGEVNALTALFSGIGLVGKSLARDLRVAGLLNILGTTGETNVQGETVKKLDEIANETFVGILQQGGVACALASEEMEKPVMISRRGRQSRYMVLFDPLDGSSNTDVNMPLGSIFSIVAAPKSQQSPVESDLLQKGTEQVAAGYLLFGPSTMLVFTTGQGVHGFTLDPSVGEYLLSHEAIKIPARGKAYAINEGNYHKWPAGTRQYIDSLKKQDKSTGRPYSGRYSGCLVADVHRLLLGGGIYLYPGEIEKPEGKLRLLYEANPMALVVEQAGGRASTGLKRILDVEPKKLHQRVPLIIGSRDDVAEAEASIQSAV
ncbi:MAG TPA: class 1 fructose-bisphosphatase [Nitrospira sp.]